MTPLDVIGQAVDEHRPAAVFAMFSGGHDSVTSTHIAAQHPSFSGVLHINTGIGIEETRDYVRATCDQFGWLLIEKHAPAGWYENYCLTYGMPGGPLKHGIMYQRLKDDQIMAVIREYKGFRGDRVGLVTGARRHESRRRMRIHPEPIHREYAQVWIAPILDWTATDVNAYMAEHGIPRNPVVDKLHRSGECLCGALARPEELDEIGFWFPEVKARIMALEKQCYDRGLPYRWGSEQAAFTFDALKASQEWLPLCESCPTRWEVPR